MSLNDKFIYGLATDRLLNDVQDKEQAITSLGLIKSDLTAILGANQVGVTNQDLITVSGLNSNIYPVLDRYSNNLAVASTSLQDVVGADSPVIRGNLILNGQLAASGITYNKLDLTNPNKYSPLSISTAVNSAWSFFDLTFTDQTDLYYGNQVTVNNALSVSYLGSQLEPDTQVFSAEIPTHMVQIQVGADTYGVFAQAGAPLELEGNFQNFRGRVARNTLWPGLYVSWRIQQAGVTQAQAEDVLPVATNITFNSNQPEIRSLQIYYPASGISELTVPNMGLRSWPLTILDQLITLDVSINQLLDVPNLKVLTPNLKTCVLNDNRFYLSANSELRRLGVAVGDRLPVTLESLIAHDAFVGSMVDGTPVAGTTLSVLNSLPNLKVFRVGRLNSSFRGSVGPDNVDTVGYFPDVTLTESGTSAIVEYTVRDTTLRDLTRLTNLRTLSPELVTLDLGANNFASSANFSVNSDKIQVVSVAGTRINIMDMRNRTELINYAGNQVNQLPEPHSLFVNSNPTDADYKFLNCAKLQTLSLQNSSYTGFFPKLAGNSSLISLDAGNTQFSGGRPGIIQTSVAQQVTNSKIINVLDATGIVPDMLVSGVGIPANTQVISVKNNRVEVGTTISAISVGVPLYFGNHVLAEDTFVDCVNLRTFNFTSAFMFSFALHPNVFTGLRNLDFLRIQSNGRLGGALPVFSNCVNLSSLDLSNNAFIGTVPTFITNTRLTSIQLSNNRLTGSLPVWNLPNLSVLNLTNNRISSFATNGSTTTLGSLPRLRQLRLNFNQINNALPMLSEQVPLLERLEIQNNQITTYVKGTLTSCNRLSFINFNNNRLNQTAINNIILDVDQSVQLTRRSGTLTLIGAQNAVPSSTPIIVSALARLRAAGWQVQTNSL